MIAITGGQGFIGRQVCSALMDHGYDIIAIDTQASHGGDGPSLFPTEIIDIRHQEEVYRVFRRYPITTIIHLAAVLNTASRRNPFEATQVNILGSLYLLEAARQYGIGKVLFGSSISVYGSQETSNVEDRDLLLRPPAPENPYGTAKRHVEMLGMTYHQQFGVPFVALRIASVVGAGARSSTSNWRSEIFEFPGERKAGTMEIHIPFSGAAQLPLVFVEDVAAMFVQLVEAPLFPRQIYNTPAEMWTMQSLGTYVESIAPHIQVSFDQSPTENPDTITGRTFAEDFGFSLSMSLRERLRKAGL